MFKQLTQIVTLLTASISMVVIPNASYANYTGQACCPPPCNECCEEECCETSCINKYALIGGAVVLGAVAGAIGAQCRKGKKGHRGDPGKEQNQFWVRDDGNSISFRQLVTVDAVVKPGGYMRLQPIVIGPDNETFQGIPQDVTAGGNFVFEDITVKNPRQGNYQIGFYGQSLLANGTVVKSEAQIMFSTRFPDTPLQAFLPIWITVNTDNAVAGINTNSLIYSTKPNS